MKFHIKTYGCQMNDRDSESVGALLVRHGHAVAAGEADADVIIVNTCSVRGKAEDKALGKLGLLVASKRDYPDRIVGAMGCMVQRLQGEVLEKVRGLDFAVGTHRLSRLPAILQLAAAGRGPVLDAGDGAGLDDDLGGHAAGGVSAFVNILLGCDRRCTYCVVPEVRGPEWSRPAGQVLAEVSGLAAQGVREVTLLGQSVMSYGRRRPVWAEDYVSPRGLREPLTRLLEAVASIEGIARVRFTSGHPSGCTPELARAMAKIPELCEHMHLPLQSGSDRILELMRRGYTADEYRLAVQRLREHVPTMVFTTDIIVGFPSETEAEFGMTRQLCSEIGFDNAFVFKYSARPGTEAEKLPDDILPEEKMRRNKVLLEDQAARALAHNQALVGRVSRVLVEGVSLRNADRWSGRTRTHKIVVFDPVAGIASGDLVDVRVEHATAQAVYGKVCT
jgi:tRNA-2-methylthio-N6-dimethylallyladenosine synthase